MGDMVGKCGTMGTERNVADRQPDRKIKRRYYFHNFFFFFDYTTPYGLTSLREIDNN